MIANFLVSRNPPGTRGVIASGAAEFNPTWGDGSATNFAVSTFYRPDDDVAFIGWRRANGRYVARIDTINGVARPEPFAVGSRTPIVITGQFPADPNGIRVEFLNFSGRIRAGLVSYRPDRIEFVPPATLPAGSYQVHVVGPDATREIITRGNQLVTFR